MLLRGRILNPGKVLITNALLGLSATYATGFKVGDMYGFEVDPAIDTAPRGMIVHEATQRDIAVTRVAFDTVRFVCSIPEGAGPFYMGNMVLYMEDENQEPVPFVMVAFPALVHKQPSNDQITTDGFTIPGTRFAISIEIKHSDELTDVQVIILPPDYSSLPAFATELDVPPGSSMTYKQFVVNYDTRVRSPVLVTIDDNNVRWAQPFSTQLLDPHFGQLDGGMDGEGYGGEAEEIVFGGWYTTPNSAYTTNPVGGATYLFDPQGMVGGAGYTVTQNQGPLNL